MRDEKQEPTFFNRLRENAGQAMIEYALILVLLAVALGVAIAATGPVVGNIFSNVVFELLQQTPPGENGVDIEDPIDFWNTVTAVAMTPEGSREAPLPTRTPAPPSMTPTPGPSPTPSPTVPTNTPIPSNTPPPTATPLDITRVAPYLDTVDHPELWRVNASVFLGTNDWCGEYYPSTNLSGTPITRCNREFGPQYHATLDFDWGDGGPIQQWPGGAGDPASWYNNYSVRFTREIYAEQQYNVVVNVAHNDGMRVFMDGTSVYNRWSDGIYADSFDMTIDPGVHTIVVEYYERAGTSRVMLDFGIAPNEDDTAVDNGGNPTGGAVNCNWGQYEHDTDPFTADFMWDEYLGDDFERNMRCHLEFRGYVFIPSDANSQGFPTLSNPEFVYWDVWDMQSDRQSGWLEIAEYVELAPGVVDRDNLDWQRVNLRQGSTTNYNWTRNVVDLTNVNGNNYLGKNVTFRFVMEARDTGSRGIWYIDNIEFRDGIDYHDSNDADMVNDDFGVGDHWDMGLAEQAFDFITTDTWRITATKHLIDTSCCAWEDSPGENYTDFSESPDWWPDDRDYFRIHYIEFRGWINIPDNGNSDPDYEGDTGPGLLSFYQAYELGRYTGLEVQYTTEPYGVGDDNWQVVPGPGGSEPAAGLLRDRFDENSVSRPSLEFTEVSLEHIPANRFRLRFAMLVRGSAEWRDGWWIDDIRIEREGDPRYSDYPFFDGAEEGLQRWNVSGEWWRTQESSLNGDHAFTDSPTDDPDNTNNYERGDSSLTLDWPVDFNNDTPINLAQVDRNPAGGNSYNAAAVEPVLSFWHRRDLASYDNFVVEWKRESDPGDDWNHLWSYIYRMGTERNEFSERTATQLTWERVEIDLRPLTRTFNDPGDNEEDDIVFRFRLEADDNWSVDDGVWIDDIRIEERDEQSWRLWTPGTNPDIGGEQYGNGNGTRYFDDFDNRPWWENWHAGGGWAAVDWEQNSGILSFHESPDLQVDAPSLPIVTVTPGDPPDYDFDYPVYTTSGSNDPFHNDLSTPHDTFNVLEMTTVMDLRATDSDDKPTLYFWNRYYQGNDDRMSVEISYELTGDQASIHAQMGNWCRNSARLQCYEHVYGWSEWEEVWYRRNDYEKAFGWERQQVDLSDYASPDGSTPGRRIKIRFVYDAYDNSNNRDGWFIDDVSIQPRQDRVLVDISEQAFFDDASNLSNWVTEGNWGLSPELFRGEGGGAVALGVWHEEWKDCDNCRDYAPDGTRWRDRFAAGADVFMDTNFDGQAPDYERDVFDIDYNVRRNAPVPGHFDEEDSFVGRWTLETPIIGTGGVDPGDYTFIAYADDGVRVKYEEIDGPGGNVIGPPAPNDLIEWNIIYHWSDHSGQPDMGVASFEAGKMYRVTAEYYENGGDATMILSTGGSNFSFTDSPKQGAGPAFPEIPSIMLANTSLILNGTLDLTDTTNPVLEWYQYYEMRGTLRVEISDDGGFGWDRIWSRGDGDRLPRSEGEDWELRQQSLNGYVNRQIMIRFRLDRTDWNDGRQFDYDSNNQFLISWWIADIRVADAG